MHISCEATAPVDTPAKVQSSKYLFLAEVVSLHDAERIMVLHIRHMFRMADIDYIRQKWV
jgi:hypothetical protein